MLRLYVLDHPHLERDGAPVEVDRQKALALLAYLAASGRPQRRDVLASLLWPDYDQSRASAYLRRTLWSVNQALGHGALDVSRETIGLAATPALWHDLGAFRALLAAVRAHHRDGAPCAECVERLADAAALYRDDFLAGLTLRDSPDFETWQLQQAEQLRGELAWALDLLAEGRAAGGAFAEAIPAAQRRLALDPLHEPAQRALIRLYARAGQRSAAIRQYQECARLLDAELGAAPEAATVALYEQIRVAGAESQLPGSGPEADRAAFAAPPAAGGSAAQPPPDLQASAFGLQPAVSNLPPQLTHFVGRDAELAQIDGLLADPACRLLTLAGPGGIGKTRLGIEAATRRAADYRHGAVFIPLAPLTSEDDVVLAIAGALQLNFFRREELLLQLVDYLREKQLLLVLDNFEHLIPHAGLLSEILRQAHHVRLLVTSRQRLNLRGEWVLEVGGLPFPDDGRPTTDGSPDESSVVGGRWSMDDLERYDAVQLFLQHARRVSVGFTPAGRDPEAIVRICRLVDGMPLGIELAAVWVRLLSCEEIAQEIERCLDFLDATGRDVPPAHRSLRAVFEHSWSLLSAEQRAVFRRLSVFRGGFTREGAAAVCGGQATGDGRARQDAGVSGSGPAAGTQLLPILGALVDQSLLRRGAGGRYELHEVLRQYAAEELGATPGEQELARALHGAYYTGLLEREREPLKGRGQQGALRAIREEIENVRAAWRWVLERRDAERVEASCDSLLLFYEMQGWFEEGEEVFRRASEALGPDSGALYGQLRLRHAWFAFRSSSYEASIGLFREGLAVALQHGASHDYVLTSMLPNDDLLSLDESEELLRSSLAFRRASGDQYGLALCLNALGWCAVIRRRVEEGERLFKDALEVSRQAGNLQQMARTSESLGHMTQAAGRPQEARQHFQEYLDLARELGYRWATAYSLDLLGYVERRLGLYSEAVQHHQESLAISREMGDQLGIAGSLDNLGLVALDSGAYSHAQRLIDEGLAIRRKVGDRGSLSASVEAKGRLAMALGEYAEACRWFEECARLRHEVRAFLEESRARAHQGRALLACGDLDAARACLRTALSDSIALGEISAALTALIGAAELLAAGGNRGRAGELLRFVVRHEATSQYKRDIAERLLVEWGYGPERGGPVRLSADAQRALLDGALRDLWGSEGSGERESLA